MDNEKIASELSEVVSLVSKKRYSNDSAKFAALFAMFLVGDRKAALSRMKSLLKSDVEGSVAKLEPSEFNSLFGKMVMDFNKVIKKHLPV